MNVDVERLPESRVTLKIELTPEEIEGALQRTYKQLVQRVNIPGFRKGKAPRPVLERMIGADAFLHEATDEAVRWGYRKAIDQENLIPLDEADVDVPGDEHSHVHEGEPFRFEATVTVRPDVELPDYHAIKVQVETVEVTEDDIEGVLHELQERNATLEPVNRPAQVGDTITMNVAAGVGGDEIVNEENAEFEVRDEENSEAHPLFPGLSEKLVGAKAGDIEEISLPLPENYDNPELAGQTMFLRVLVKEVKRKVLPEINDELAESVSQFETLDELKGALRQNLEAEKRMEADEKLVRDSIDALVSRTFVEIPPLLIEEELDRMLEDLERAFSGQGMSLELYLQTTGKPQDELREEMREGAAQNVKTSLVMGALADAENIEVTNKEIDAAIDDLFRGMRVSERERRELRSSSGVRSNLRTRLRRQRAIRRLVQVVTGEEISAEAAEAFSEEGTAPSDDSEETVAVEVGG
jgi:trigger factor